jgi:hypothetical protein
MSKHTPGPWEWNGQNQLWGGQRGNAGALEEVLMAADEDGHGIIRHHYDEKQAAANARLIASAPTMYARIAALEEEIASAKELARNNAERSNANYVAMKDAQDERDSLLEFIDLTIERREAFADYSARIKGYS